MQVVIYSICLGLACLSHKHIPKLTGNYIIVFALGCVCFARKYFVGAYTRKITAIVLQGWKLKGLPSNQKTSDMLGLLIWRGQQPFLPDVVIFWSYLIGGQSRWFPETRSREMRSFLPEVAEQLFQDIQKAHQETSQSKTRLAE